MNLRNLRNIMLKILEIFRIWHWIIFSDFDFTTLLGCFVNTEHFIHFSHWASTLFNLITWGKKIQFPCRNPLFHRQHHHNYQSVILLVSIFSVFTRTDLCHHVWVIFKCWTFVMLTYLIKIRRRQIPILIHSAT